MVLLVERLGKLYSKLENLHHHHRDHDPEALSASLRAFRSEISSSVTQLLSNSKPGGFDILSLEWIQKCFQVLPSINKAFAKLVVEIEYDMSEWKEISMEAYLNYSLEILDLFNSISSSISYLEQSRVSFSHALSVVQASPNSSGIDRLRAIEFKRSGGGGNKFKVQENEEDRKEGSCSSGKERVVLQALMEMRSVELWLCSIMMVGLSGESKIYLQMRKSAGVLSNPSLVNLDSVISGVVIAKRCVLKEVKELKDSGLFVAAAVSAGENRSRDAAEEMQRKLEVFENLLDGLGKTVNSLFSDVLARRNQLLNGIRFRKQ
ncbi:uncharacterized protein LOC126662212 [Mercurialis annua]|uniref:uncharacterized protein LOC126662212 n=1 Tax=Mercurialis annua TaxID=3986 RepID=UPI002160EC8B|nr:uncharacterized protein LOC126662212 [Mercurialis annua]